jgi:hypothetical protein
MRGFRGRMAVAPTAHRVPHDTLSPPFCRVALSTTRVSTCSRAALRARLALTLMLSTILLAGQASAAWAQADDALAAPARETFVFDLPALPLGEALTRYGELTQRSILYETRWVVGRQSTALQGEMTPDAALDALLQGSGLAARTLSPDAVSIYPVAGQALDVVPDERRAAALARYDGYLQRVVFESLCGRPALRAEGSRIVLRFSIDGQRRLSDLRVRVAARPDLEPVVREALAGTALNPPPPGVAQPVLMVVAQDADAWRQCPGAAR